jgi:two-component system chemotaxis response regulator CheB
MLSGLGNDGARAMARLAQGGGACFALHPDDCRAPHMPRAALAASAEVVPVRAGELADRVRREVAVVAKSLS